MPPAACPATATTLGLSSLGGDGRGTGIVFTYTYNAATGQYGYYNSTYGWFNQLTYTSSSSAGDVTDLSLFGTNNLSLANTVRHQRRT